MQPILLIKEVIMIGLAMWLSIACLNNMLDQSTNRHLIGSMLSMSLIKEDGFLGHDLLHRAWHNEYLASIILRMVIIVQAIISILLWWGAIQIITAHSVVVANYALLSFMSFWLCFLCGGLWFAYWIKMGQVQMVHLTLLLISLLSIIVINLPLML